MLGTFLTNSKQIDPQLMQTFLIQQQVFSYKMPDYISSLSLYNDALLMGSILQTVSITPADSLQLRSLSHCTIGSSDYETNPSHNIRTIPPFKEYVLDDSVISDIRWMYK